MEIINGINLNKKFKIPTKIKSYKIEKELCTISNAHLCLASNLNIKEKVLIKIYDKEIIQYNPDQISLINNEIFMMRLVNHKHILKLYEIIESPSYIFLIMEYFNNIKLIDFIKNKKKLSENDSLNIFKQLISILLYFNEMRIGHFNLNPNDILIDNNNNIKLCDFKYSSFYTSADIVKCIYIGDTNYLCPELLSEKSCYPELADIWSSGVILYLCITGQLPFQGINNYDLQKTIMDGEFALPLNISKNMQELIKCIFEVKTEFRYNLDKILNSALFKEKKINKNNLPKGFNILSTKYPIDDRVMNICNNYFGIEIEDLKQKLFKNIFDPQTSLYKQIITKFIRKKISNEIDLNSKKFNNFIENKKHILDDNTQQNNIQENITKLEEIQKGIPEIKTKINEKNSKVLIKLDELLAKYKTNIDKKEPETKKKIELEKDLLKEKEENKDNIYGNKKHLKQISTSTKGKNYKKRGSENLYPKKSKYEQLSTYENQLDSGRRKSSAADSNDKIKETLDKLSYPEISDFESRKETIEKYIPEKNDIITESKEEEKKEPSPNKSAISITGSRISLLSKTSSKITENTFNLYKTNVKVINGSNNKDKKMSKISSIKSKGNKLQKEKEKKNYTAANASSQVTKEDFFKQINNVQLKKNNHNTHINTDERKRKSKEENKNTTSVENSNIFIKGILQMVEDNLKKEKKNKINLSTEPRKKETLTNHETKETNNSSYKTNSIKNNNTTYKKNKNYKINTGNRRKRTIKTKGLYMFQNKGILINKNEIKNEKSKDDASRFKFNEKDNNDILTNEYLDEIIDEIVLPKDFLTEKNLKEEKLIKLEENKEQEDEERDKEENKRTEIKIRKQNEQEESTTLIIKKEEGIRDELEEEERRMKEREAEEERQRIAEEEMKKRREEERERKIKEREEEDKRREEEENLRKEREKERIRLEEEEKIKKWKNELKRKKEKEEREKKEAEERERKEEEERIRKRKEESEKKRREIQEENKRRFEEYEKMRKEEEEKQIMKEKMKKEQEREIRRKREKYIQNLRNNERKKTLVKELFESEKESSEEQEISKPKTLIIKSNFFEESNQTKKTKNDNKFTLSTNPFDLYKEQYSDESSTPKNIPKKEIKKQRVSVNSIKKKKKIRS